MMMNQKPSIYIPTAYLDDIEYFYDSDDESSLDLTSTDEFRMYEFKIRRCGRARSHDWTECPFAHPGEKAKRRDPRKFHYSGTSCPDFRKGNCKRGDSCDMSHGVFECWLHPARYRTQPCKDGVACRRRVCFFAHTPEQLRVLPTSPKTVLEGYDGSPMRRAVTSPDSSPLLSPVIAGLRRLQLDKVKSMSSSCPSSSYLGMRFGDAFCSVPTTPTAVDYDENEGFVERVESGRALRMKLYERLSKENCTVEKKDSDADPVWFN